MSEGPYYTFDLATRSYVPATAGVLGAPGTTKIFVFQDGMPVEVDQATEDPTESPGDDSPRAESHDGDSTPAVDEAPANAELLDAEGTSPLVRIRRGTGEDTEIVAGRVSVREDSVLVFTAASTGEEG